MMCHFNDPRRFIISIAITLAMFTSAMADEPVGPKLTPTLRNLLQQEMIALRQASQNILDALIMGVDETIAVQAQTVHDSFIMAVPRQHKLDKMG